MSRNIARYRHIRALSNAYPSPVEVQVHQPISEKKSNLRDSFLRGLCFGGVSALGLWTFKQFYGLEKAEAAQISDGGVISRRQRFNFVTEVVAETKASLVYIKIKDKQVRNFYTGEQQIVSNGSGFIVGQDGLILTNAHVVEGKPRTTIEVELQDGRTFVARVEDMDRNGDLATLRINCKNLPVMKLGTSADIEAGEFVIALGSPLALSNVG